MKSLLSAVAFLTIIPVPTSWLDAEQDYSRCVKYFPLIGVLLGGLTAAVAVAVAHVLPQMPCAVLVTAFMVAVSGALHLDGLADTADGFLSSRPREQVLEIMRDSRIGTMGVAVIVFVLLLKVVLIAELLATPTLVGASSIALAVFAGRCSLVWSMRLNGYARNEGLGRGFWYRSWFLSLLALAVLSVVSWQLVQYRGLAGVVAAVAIALGLAFWCHRKIGGATGDTAGACCELAEVFFLLGSVGVNHAGLSGVVGLSGVGGAV